MIVAKIAAALVSAGFVVAVWTVDIVAVCRFVTASLYLFARLHDPSQNKSLKKL